MMTHLRRALFILLAGCAVSVGILALSGSGWAERMRLGDQERQAARYKYFLAHKQPARRPNEPRSTPQRYVRGFAQVVVFELGLPCAVTLGILAYTRRKR